MAKPIKANTVKKIHQGNNYTRMETKNKEQTDGEAIQHPNEHINL